MTWIIISVLLVIVGAFFYRSNKRNLSGSEIVHNDAHSFHEHNHNNKSGHSCCH